MTHIGLVYITSNEEDGIPVILLQSIMIQMGGVSRCSSPILRSGVDVTLLNEVSVADVSAGQSTLEKKKKLGHPSPKLESATWENILQTPRMNTCKETCSEGTDYHRHQDYKIRGQKINANFFCTKFFDNPSGHGRPRRKSWTSAPKSAFSCGPGGGEKLFDPGASGRKGQECPQEIRTKKFMFMLFFLPCSKHLLTKPTGMQEESDH